ncbi:hypothetical protein JCM3766R1_000323 [Sporobolomyces carnicolor]
MSPAPRPSHDASQAPLPPRDGAGITEDEAALYDRQLRLWGVEAQNRMRQSRVLLAGSFRGISTEVAKNIVLAGVGKVSLLDDSKVEWRDLGSGYWQREEDIGQFRVEVVAPRLQLLNPRVEITTHTRQDELLADEIFLDGFDLIVVTDRDAKTVSRVNALCRKLSKKFFAAASVGIHGWVFADLLQHDFVIDEQKSAGPGEPTKVVPLKLSRSYCPFDDALTKHDFGAKGQKKLRKKTMKKREVLWAVLCQSIHQLSRSSDLWVSTLRLESEQEQDGNVDLTTEILRKKADEYLPSIGVAATDLSDPVISRFISLRGHEFAPSCAIVGGVLGQDVLNTVGGKEEPVRNLMVFDGDLGEGGVWALGC